MAGLLAVALVDDMKGLDSGDYADQDCPRAQPLRRLDIYAHMRL
jgi:hypothetical protein